MLSMHSENAVKRADDKGAVAIFDVDIQPGNMAPRAYPSVPAPAFTLGGDEGLAVRDLIGSLQGQTGAKPR